MPDKQPKGNYQKSIYVNLYHESFQWSHSKVSLGPGPSKLITNTIQQLVTSGRLPHRTLPALSPPSFCSSGHSCCPQVRKTVKPWWQLATQGWTLFPWFRRRHHTEGRQETQKLLSIWTDLYLRDTTNGQSCQNETHFHFRYFGFREKQSINDQEWRLYHYCTHQCYILINPFLFCQQW